MSRFVRKILGLSDSHEANVPDTAVHLAAFGKHPAWDDHLDDIGLETERLVRVRRVLYVEGIGGNIDSGRWDELEETGGAIPFGHSFAWRWEGGTTLGRLWASHDRKGRGRYPMVLCADCAVDLPESLLSEILVELQRTQIACEQATDPDAVRAAIATQQQNLDNTVAAAPDPPESLQRTMTALTGDTGKSNLLAGLCHLQATDDPLVLRLHAGLVRDWPLQWMYIARQCADAAGEWLAIQPNDASYGDLIRGPLSCEDFFPLRAGLTVQPCESDATLRFPAPAIDHASRLIDQVLDVH